MRRVQILLVGVLILAVVAGCGGGRDVDIEIHVGDQATEAASTGATAPPPPADRNHCGGANSRSYGGRC